MRLSTFQVYEIMNVKQNINYILININYKGYSSA